MEQKIRKSCFNCEEFKIDNSGMYWGICQKSGHPLENGYAMRFHSTSCNQYVQKEEFIKENPQIVTK